MAIQNKIQEIEKLKSEIESRGIFHDEIKKKIDYKFRLDWNYFSNKMEGGTLTTSETRSVMVGNIDVDGKPLKDLVEMKNHDNAVLDILKIAKGEQQLSENRIYDLHKAIMYEENPSKKKLIGKRKEENNEVINYKGEKFTFSLPSEVPERLHNLLDKTKAELEKYFRNKKSKHPIEIATDFHIEFLTIHPFYDGNGRISRILTNLILISCGFPPIIIKEKEIYYRYLADIQCYGGDKKLLTSLFCDLLLESQQLVLKAINGQNIEDENDLDKQIALLDKEINAIDSENEILIEFNQDIFYNIFETWFSQLFQETITIVQKFNKYFIGTRHKIFIGSFVNKTDIRSESATDILMDLKDRLKEQRGLTSDLETIRFMTFYGTFKKGGLESFGCDYSFIIRFNQYKYEVLVDIFYPLDNIKKLEKKYENLYTKPLKDFEIKDIANSLGKSILNHIEQHISRL